MFNMFKVMRAYMPAPPSPAPDAGPKILRKVTIGSRPWSAFYIDGGAARHETPETVDLAPGKHTLQLLLGDQMHVPHNPPVISKKITIEVKP